MENIIYSSYNNYSVLSKPSLMVKNSIKLV